MKKTSKIETPTIIRPNGMPGPLPFMAGSRKKAIIINIFGGPGAGKSTVAAGIFYRLKRLGIEVAAPEEHAKIAIWSGQSHLLDNQIVLLGRTWETISALDEKVEIIVLDSPALLCSVYAGKKEGSAFHELCENLHRRHTRLNIILERGNMYDSYTQNGRRETLGQAIEVDHHVLERLESMGEDIMHISSDDQLMIDTTAEILARVSRRRIC